MPAPPPVPALPDAARVTTYAAASAGPFSVGFAIYGDSTDYTAWVLVTLDGVEQTGNWVLDSPSGSLATLPRPITDARITFTNPVTGALVITGARRPRRTSQNDEGRGVTARDWNQQLTDIIAMEREAWDARDRQVLVPPGETAALLPPAAARALQLLGFDNVGNPIAAQPSSALVSSAMADVVAAVSHAAAIALLGAAPASAIIPIGMPAMWPGLVVPSLWLPRDGTTRLRAGFPELWAVLGPTIAATVTSGSAAVAVASTAGYATGWPVEGAGIAPGTTILAIPDATHITLSAVAIGNDTSVKLYPFGNGDGVNSFTLPDARGIVEAGLDLAQTKLTGGHKLAAALGSKTATLVNANLPPYTPSGTVGITDPGRAFIPNTTGAAGAPSASNFGQLTPQPTGITAAFTGAAQGGVSTPVGIVQPTQIYQAIIYAGH